MSTGPSVALSFCPDACRFIRRMLCLLAVVWLLLRGFTNAGALHTVLPDNCLLSFGGFMRPVSRFGVNKSRSARGFRRSVGRTKGANMSGPMRGGIRL